MTSRLRERRRGNGRAPGILRTPATAQEAIDRPIGHSARRSMGSWRIVSAMIVLSLIGVLALFFITPFFYIHSIAVGGLQYVTKEEVFALSGIANMHIFWIDPEAVRQAVLAFPYAGRCRP